MSTLFVNNLNTASGSTITVPTGKKLVVTDAGGISAPGMIVQVARTYNASSSHISTASTSLVASGIQCSLTPKFSNSLILVDFSTPMMHSNAGDKIFAKMYLKIGSASIAAMPGAGLYHVAYTNGLQYQSTVFSGSYTASSTDTLMFEPYFENGQQAVAVYLVHSSSSYSLTVMEVAQ